MVFPESPEARLLPLLWGATRALPPSSALSSSQGRKWWMNTDEPWQVLACCMEIAQASRSPDPAAFVSHFPVHQVGAGGLGAGRGAGAEPGHPGAARPGPLRWEHSPQASRSESSSNALPPAAVKEAVEGGAAPPAPR